MIFVRRGRVSEDFGGRSCNRERRIGRARCWSVLGIADVGKGIEEVVIITKMRVV